MPVGIKQAKPDSVPLRSSRSCERKLGLVQPVLCTSNLYSTQNSIFSPSDRIVFSVIAGLLFLTALAKIWMLLTDPSADVRLGISREVL